MGGLGSGRRWNRPARRLTVEESPSLGIRNFRGHIFQGSAGTITWTRAGTVTNSIGFSVTWGDVPILTLRYRWRDKEDVSFPIRLQTTSPYIGGVRWWFTCPLIVGGVPCKRRVRKLYLPPGTRYFGCRHCHRLTYRSSQKAHECERYLDWIDSIPRWLERQRQNMQKWSRARR
jgi:hypothetical protein